MQNSTVGNSTIRSMGAAYAKKRPKSQKMNQRAQRVMPGGDTRSVTFYPPFPLVADYGEGCRLTDIDGYRYIDFVNNYNSLIHGHVHPKVTEAVIRQVKKGTVHGFSTVSQCGFAEEICGRLPSAEKVRFCNSGAEATLSSIRLARFIRKKYKIAKIEGGYHGIYDLGLISLKPPLEKVGAVENPNSVPEDDSVPPNVLRDCIVLPFNNVEIAKRRIEKNHNDLAAIIVEPMLGPCGMVLPEPGYLECLKELSRCFGIILIFDEVLTFRVARGGYQERANVIPDLTALGKIIGGGFPVGAIAGRAEYMDFFSPKRRDSITHSGTFNGNSITMAAGLESLKLLTDSEIERINGYGELIRNRIQTISAKTGITCQVTGTGSVAQIHFTAEAVRDWRSAATARLDLRSLLHMSLLEKGFLIAPRGFFNISTPMSENEIRALGDAMEESFLEMKTYVEKNIPELLA